MRISMHLLPTVPLLGLAHILIHDDRVAEGLALIICAGVFVGLAGFAVWQGVVARHQAAERAAKYRRLRCLAEMRRLASECDEPKRGAKSFGQ